MKKVVNEVEEPGVKRLDLLSVVYFFVFLAVAIAFFVLLNGATGSGFGFSDIVFALVFAFFMASLLVWIKSIIVRNPYLGVSIGVLMVIGLGYGFSLRYWGGYSIMFLVGTAVLVLIYFSIYFFKFRDREKQIPNEFDEG